MKATVEEVNSVQRRVKVSVTKEKVDEAFLSKFKSLRSKVSIKGFRQGKAPINMLRRYYGASVAPEVFESLVKETLFSAIETNELRPVASPVIENSDLPEEGKDYNFSALIDVLPNIQLANFKGLSATCEVLTVDDTMIQNELDSIAKRKAKIKPLEGDVTAQKGHLAVLTHSAKTEDGAEIPSLNVEKFSVELGANQLFPDLEQAIVGMKANESKEVAFKLPKDYGDAELQDKTVTFNVKVEELKEIEAPAIDDELAKDIGLESLADLKENVTKNLQSEADRMKRQQLETSLLDQIYKGAPFEVPPSMVDSLIDNMIGEMRWPSDEDKQRALQDEEIRTRFKDTAKKRAQSSLILLEVAKTENIQVTEADIDERLKAMVAGSGNETSDETMKQIKASLAAQMQESMLFEKAMNAIIDSAKVVEIPKKA